MPQIREFSVNLEVSERTLEKESRAQGLLPQPGEHGRSTVLGVILRHLQLIPKET